MSQIDLQIGYKIKGKRRKLGISQANMAQKIVHFTKLSKFN